MILLLLLACLLLADCKRHHEAIFREPFSISGGLPCDSALIDSIMIYKRAVDSLMGEVIGRALTPIKKGKPSAPLNEIICDALLNEIRKQGYTAHISIMNYGGIRNNISRGEITTGTVYEVYPFDNRIALVMLPKSLLGELGRLILKKRGIPVAGFSVSLDTLRHSFYFNFPFDTSRIDTIIIATSDYLINGSDDFEFFKKCRTIVTDILVRNALINHIKERKEIEGVDERRCRFIE